MDPLRYNQLLQRPIYTGNPVAIQQNRDAVESPGEEQPSFQTLLEERIREESTVAFPNMPWNAWWNGMWTYPPGSWNG